jgi:multidrug resistance efflux pump
MIAFLTLCYVAILALLVWLKILPNKAITWLSTLVWMFLLFVVLFIPMQWGAPAGPTRILTYSVQVIPNVAGEVTEVPVKANVPVKEGDVLFKIDPTTYEAAVDSTRSQLELAKLRFEQYSTLAARDAGTRFKVEEAEARVRRLTAELKAAEWNLRETTVRAPSDGVATYVALRPGQRVVTFPLSPAMTFIESSRNIIGAQIHQIYIRHIKPGQPVEIRSNYPGYFRGAGRDERNNSASSEFFC